jgi:hypothetical protein
MIINSGPTSFIITPSIRQASLSDSLTTWEVIAHTDTIGGSPGHGGVASKPIGSKTAPIILIEVKWILTSD